ncbi:MAG TPA: glycosyltransferase, partial [Anaerolineaceae bacterium]|nr:glycosyltransferase [Anaerolineaceae bacterium]
IVHGKTGFLYGSFEELVASMKNMVQEPEEARQMGLAGWQRARESYNIEDNAANVYKVIQSVMEKR